MLRKTQKSQLADTKISVNVKLKETVFGTNNGYNAQVDFAFAPHCVYEPLAVRHLAAFMFLQNQGKISSPFNRWCSSGLLEYSSLSLFSLLLSLPSESSSFLLLEDKLDATS